MFRVVIPARFASSRLLGKALVPLAGKPMLQWVYESACRSAAFEIIVATDDARIADAAREFGAAVATTHSKHASGTDRIAEVAHARGWASDDIIVNLQGDEPLMPAALIDQVARVLEDSPRAGLATLAHAIDRIEDLMNPDVVKVVTDTDGWALYFSRAPIPWNRDGAPAGWSSQRACDGARRHIGIYAYRAGILQRLASLPPSQLETCERLEQLRALSNGIGIRVAEATELPGPDVNTSADVERVAKLLRARSAQVL